MQFTQYCVPAMLRSPFSKACAPDVLLTSPVRASTAVLQGEGEHKIMKRINEAADSKGSHVVVGNDADIILMSLMSPVKQLYILSQQTTGKGSRFSCISFDALNMLRSSDVVSLSLAPVSTLLPVRLLMRRPDAFLLELRAIRIAGARSGL